MGQGKAFGTAGTVADPVAPEAVSSLALLTKAQHLLRRAAAQIAAEACPPEQVAGIPRSVQDVRDLEEVIKTAEQTKWVLDGKALTTDPSVTELGKAINGQESTSQAMQNIVDGYNQQVGK